MDNLIQLIDKLIWPTTVIAAVYILRSGLLALIPTLKTLKYKELELEFEREARTILSEAERDLPEISENDEDSSKVLNDFPGEEETDVANSGTKGYKKRPRVMYSKGVPTPYEIVMSSWGRIETTMRAVARKDQLNYKNSTKSLIDALLSRERISEDMAKTALRLAAFKNKIIHADEAITEEVAESVKIAANRIYLPLIAELILMKEEE